MKRVLAVVLIAALATLTLGIDSTASASQSGDQKQAEKDRADVAKALGAMQRGTTARVERKDGTKFDVVIEEITPDSVTVLRQIGERRPAKRYQSPISPGSRTRVSRKWERHRRS